MKIIRKDKDWNRVNTREELLFLLQKYESILNDNALNYLLALIDLEFSVVRNNISDDARKKLSELEIYKKVAIYNIYYRALHLFEQSGQSLDISGNANGIEGLVVHAPIADNSVKLFEFNYAKVPCGSHLSIPSDYKTMRVGDVFLYQTIESAEHREAELMRVMQVLDRLYDEENPYCFKSRLYGNPASQWSFNHDKKILAYEEKFRQLDNKRELTLAERQEIEITKHFHNLLLEDYGLTDESFVADNSLYVREKSNLHRKLVKKTSNLDIENNIKYI